jgi:hypothetical protein
VFFLKENPLSLSSLPSLPAGPTPIPFPFSFSPQTLSGRRRSFPSAQAAHAGPSSPSTAQHHTPLFFFGQATGRWGPAVRPSFYLRPRVNRAPSWLASHYRPPPPRPSPSASTINLPMKLPLHSPSLIDRYPLNPPSPP